MAIEPVTYDELAEMYEDLRRILSTAVSKGTQADYLISSILGSFMLVNARLEVLEGSTPPPEVTDWFSWANDLLEDYEAWKPDTATPTFADHEARIDNNETDISTLQSDVTTLETWRTGTVDPALIDFEARLDALEAVPVSGSIDYDPVAETATLNLLNSEGAPARNVYVPMAIFEESGLDLIPDPPAVDPGFVAEITAVNSWVYPITDVNGQIVIAAKKNTVKAPSRIAANLGGIVLIDDVTLAP